MKTVARPLRLLVFDCTCVGRGARPGLSDAWRAGKVLYRGLGRIDAAFGASSWSEALGWLVREAERTGRPLGEVQYWGHGRRGRGLVDADLLDVGSLRAGGLHHDRLRALREAFAVDASGFWFRTCETLGGQIGQTFAREWADFFGHRVAGHTHVIGFWQSGLYSLRPGAQPSWATSEGARGSEAAVALDSAPTLPHTISCLSGTIPAGW